LELPTRDAQRLETKRKELHFVLISEHHDCAIVSQDVGTHGGDTDIHHNSQLNQDAISIAAPQMVLSNSRD
jgi:hypothetical protein